MTTSTISDVRDFVGKYSPLLGAALTTVNPLAGLVLSAVAGAFGANPKNMPDILTKMQVDGAAEEKIKELEIQHKDLLVKAASADFQAAMLDTQSARWREEEIVKITGKYDWVQHACALVVVSGFFGCIFIIVTTKLDQSDHDILYMLLGVLGSTFSQVYQYYFGSSSESSSRR